MKYTLLLSVTLLLSACTDVLIPDIRNERTSHISPVDGTILSSGDVKFEWTEVDFADSTRFILVSPSFIDPTFTCADTFLTTNEISLQLPTDIYEWKTIGYNDVYTSDEQVSVFEVVTDQSLWLGAAPIVLLSPKNGLATNSDSIRFEFEILAGVDQYELTIIDESENLFAKHILSDNTATCAIPAEGTYTWSAIGLNHMTNTKTSISESRAFQIDRTGPVLPTIITPLDLDTICLMDAEPHIDWDAKGADSSFITLLLSDRGNDTLLVSATKNTETTLPVMLIDTFSMLPVKIQAIIYTQDEVGNTSDTTTVIFELKK